MCFSRHAVSVFVKANALSHGETHLTLDFTVAIQASGAEGINSQSLLVSQENLQRLYHFSWNIRNINGDPALKYR